MKHAAEVVILVDPVQDWEESLVILGVYGSLAAAKRALPRLRQQYERFDSWRDSEAQRWIGDQCVETWRYTPTSGWFEVKS